LAPGSAFSIFGDVSGAYLFGSRKQHASETYQGSSGSSKSGRNSWNVDGQLGIAAEIAPNVNIAAGYRAEYWSNVAFSNTQFSDGAPYAWGDSNRFLHGPFVRVAYNIGAPRGAAPAPVAPKPAAVMAKNFIVFFDFDRSNLTPQAQATIREAAAASKTGGVQRVNVTGHADKSGADQYNMALSLRRANTVKDELVRNGVPANQIVVVGRGESQPLVPTADGVKEPQNRRVEIVLN
jgi:outer membrane protein OmpA-like peptidoglycan-associated protein